MILTDQYFSSKTQKERISKRGEIRKSGTNRERIYSEFNFMKNPDSHNVNIRLLQMPYSFLSTCVPMLFKETRSLHLVDYYVPERPFFRLSKNIFKEVQQIIALL
jgi:hypothetical protein